MDPISTLNQAMLLLRQQLAEKNQPRERTPDGKTGLPSIRPAASTPADNLVDVIRTQIGVLRAAGVEDEKQLFRVVIDMILQREFGAGTANDPSFQEMSDWVCECLREQLHAREMLHALIRG